MHDLKTLHDAILTGEAGAAKVEAERALAAGVDPLQIVNGAMMPAMNEVGRRFESEEYFVPDLLLAARAMKSALEPIRPLLVAGKMSQAGCVVIGTVKGDLHEIGKNLVAAMLEGNGFEVVDLGVDVAPERFVNVAREKQANIVALSALLTTTMGSMKATVEAIHKAGLKGKVKVLVGGAPISQTFADSIGADGFSDNAVGAVALARRVLGQAA
ncbi:MAG: corrinoid protein [Verrucomicrobiales bacterium]|nr:corrinoid protein [Verrucomicrobiales bacterium]